MIDFIRKEILPNKAKLFNSGAEGLNEHFTPQGSEESILVKECHDKTLLYSVSHKIVFNYYLGKPKWIQLPLKTR